MGLERGPNFLRHFVLDRVGSSVPGFNKEFNRFSKGFDNYTDTKVRQQIEEGDYAGLSFIEKM